MITAAQLGDVSHYRVSSHLRISSNAEHTVILDTKAGHIYLCDGLKATLLRHLAHGEAVDSIINAVTTEFKLSCDSVRTQLNLFLAELQERGFITTGAVKRVGDMALLLRAFWELIRYDFQLRILGFRRIYAGVSNRNVVAAADSFADNGLTERVIAAVARASSFYWHPIRCLQRSVATARLLHTFGAPAQLVIGYRTGPFLSHAWVEVGGQIVNDSPALGSRLMVLDRA
jgi:hypothetical protein